MQRPEEEPYHITIEIVNERCKGLKMFEGLGIQQYALVDVRSLPGGLVRHLVKIPSNQIKKLADTPSIEVRSSGKLEGRTSTWLDTDGCDLCNALLAHNSFLISGRHIEGYTVVHSFVAPNFDAFQKIISAIEATGLKPKILEVTRFKPKGKILTEKQERVLWLASKMGFFEYPRKITMLELSRRLGIALSTLSEIIRRGTRRLIEDHFET